MKRLIIITIAILSVLTLKAQNHQVNVDSLYYQAKELYSTKSYNNALTKLDKGLLIAPEYTDIRVLRIRVFQALNKYKEASKDLIMLVNSNTYTTYKELVLKQITLAKTIKELTSFEANMNVFYSDDVDYKLARIETYIRLNHFETAKSIMQTLQNNDLSQEQNDRYQLFSKQLLAISAKENQVNVDSLYYQAKELYATKSYNKALVKLNRCLLIAPEYIDIRVLRIRVYQALKKYNLASNDLSLLVNANTVNTYRNLVLRQITLAKTSKELTAFVTKINSFYSNDVDFNLAKIETYIRLNDRENAKSVAKTLKNTRLNQQQNYRYRLSLKRLNKNQIGVYHEILNFLDDYPLKNSWNTTQVAYTRFVGANAIIARVSYSQRFFDEAFLYELESYPVFSNKLYALVNLSASASSNFFQNYGASASIYYGATKWIEIEGGFRYFSFSDNVEALTYVFGLTSYVNKFYLNARTFIGPKVASTLVQNYQLNVRYYFNSNIENYTFLRIGTGISPDETTRFDQIITDPDLSAFYTTLGFSKSIGRSYTIQASVGFLNEELPNNFTGNQINGSIGLKYRF
ncbi:YaiO family outer membrane beta-barrel protein [Polaribacter litorisediminis]|uniref:YaiO family outer membrane beta-barrel protein n=1 Tax=Polaribacter litorisediminis TaxID=1908341 RepID=UPI001CBF9F34|nr:YaiO family outer membrane beta-barrel protein [Polaribacter litorisediminis]UAM98575.1 YaiO family outer membrane beta-barrel protein [Polaribacter litorisediminis]